MNKNTIRIFFNINASSSWMGGLNYYKNLFTAISKVQSPALIPLVDFDDEIPDLLKENSKQINFYFKRNIKFYIKKLINVFLKKDLDTSYNQKKIYKNFDLTSHSDKIKNKPNIQWIPDFQHIHLPDMFSKEEYDNRNAEFLKTAEESDIVILSSEDAKKDFEKCFPQYAYKARVLHFVSYFPNDLYETTDKLDKQIKEKFNLPEKYFFLPNQFWKHKNHISVFKAVALLKKQGINVHIVCTGNTKDYRNPDFFNKLTSFISENNIQENIHILGMVDYKELVYLMRYSIALLQPSLFEGWSSTIEEAKSLGKNCILSNLNVHIEQNPQDSIYFDPLDIEQISEILSENYQKLPAGPNLKLEEQAKKNMDKRMLEFGTTYQKYVLETL